MKHLGDITKINGAEIPPVDCITGGSPCQDLSVAGKRAGLDGERSGLFMEQIRIVKEMREKEKQNGRTAESCRPRWMVWENVPGAFSSNGGKDFQAVLTEIVRIVSPECPDVPMPKDGKWSKAGCLYDELGRWSIAWRVHDAQFWGVPQRRKRIALVADFGGLSAPEILFEREGLSRDPEPRGETREGASSAAESGAEGAIFYDAYQHHGWRKSETSGTLTVGQNNTVRGDTPLITDYGISSYDSNAMKSPNPHSGIYEADTARTLDLNGGSPACNQGGVAVVQPSYCLQGNGIHQPVVVSNEGDIAGTLDASYYKGTGARNGKERTVVCVGNGQLNQMSMAEQANTLDTMHDQQAVMVAAVDCRNGTENPNINGTLQAKSTGGTGTNFNNVLRANAIVRRLTPLECERLQGYPDGWTDIGEWVDSKGKKHKDADSPRYKSLGNSIALPFWFWLLRRISAQYERPATLGSLFDGIGGFPYCWERCNGKGTAIWASEIEEFPIAVTKARFPE